MSLNIWKDDLLREGSQLGEKIGFERGIRKGRKDGLLQGRRDGIAVGAYQKARETAKNLLTLKLSIENIAEATGLTKEEVEKL